MKTRSLAVFLVAIIGWLMAGCSAPPPTPEAAAASAQKFLSYRKGHDSGAMQALLTARARKVLTAGDVARYVRGEQFSYGGLGAPVEVAEGWVQVPVTDYRVATAGLETRWPEMRLTLHYEEKRWQVAWVEPLAADARQAYENSQFGDELDTGRAMAEIDPYSYRGSLEQHFAYRGLGRLREAEMALNRAAELASPYQKADVEDAMARFKLSLGHPEDAIPHARAALDAAAPYTPGLYSNRWQADSLVVLGRALLAQHDRAGAEDALKRAATVDPGNAGVAMLRRTLAATP